MAQTPFYTENLEILLEADEISGANNDPVEEWQDLSPNAHLFSATSVFPLLKTNAVPVSNKRSVIWDGTKNPLVLNSPVNIRCGFMVVKTDALPDVYGGLLGAAAANYDILVTNQTTNNFFDFLYDWYEYRLNDRIYSPVRSWANTNYQKVHTPPAPAGAFGIIYFKFWNSIDLPNVQIGQQSTFTDRKLKGEVALLALYSQDLCEERIRKQMQMISFHYKIGIADTFPFAGSRGDGVRDSREVLTDGQKEPHLRVRDSRSFRDFEANFGTRTITELQKVRAFSNSFYPDKTFLFRNYNTLPPEDTPSRFAIPTDFERAENLNLSNYQLNFVESLGTLNYTIPAAAPVLD